MVCRLMVIAPLAFTLIIVLVLFDAVMKIIALWKSARANQIVWFIFLAIINSAGILPLIYLAWFHKKAESSSRKKRR